MAAAPPVGYVIRDAKPSDHAHLAAVERSASGAGAWLDPGRFGQPTLDPAILDLCSAAGTLWIAAGERDHPVGLLCAGDLDGALFVHGLSVCALHQRRGLGASLLDRAIDHARWACFPAVTLLADANLPWRCQFYVRRGFVTLDSQRLSPGLRTRLARQTALAEGQGCDSRIWRAMAKLL